MTDNISDLTSGGRSILERLRSRSPYLDGSSAERTMDEAAAKIERLCDENALLRAALYRFWPGPCPQCSGDCYSANPPVTNCPMLQARDALEPKP